MKSTLSKTRKNFPIRAVLNRTTQLDQEHNMSINTFARERFAHLPTPVEPLARLSKALGGPEIWVKRDDCTGLATRAVTKHVNWNS